MVTPQDILKLPYERILLPEEEGGYSAYIAEFEGCAADGETADEALNNLNEAASAWISAEQAAGRSIPQAFGLQEFSGKILLRLPKTVHQRLARQADKEGVSLNQYVVQKLSADIRQDELVDLWTASLKKDLFYAVISRYVRHFSIGETSNKLHKLPATTGSHWVTARNVGMIEAKG